VGFVVDEAVPGQVFSEYFGLPCQFAFYRLSTLTIIYGLHGLYRDNFIFYLKFFVYS
jgi:hypothetical protein